MSTRLSGLSIAQIRSRYIHGMERLTPQLLHQLRHDTREGVRKFTTVLERRYERQRGARARLDGMLNFERVLWKTGVARIAGVDESGMGPLAGPVVAAAVVFAPGTAIDGIDDSKKLDAYEREAAEAAIREHASGIGLGMANVGEIDHCNIYHAGLLAMRRAVEALPVPPQHVLVDARTIPDVTIPQNSFNHGDGLNFSIAAASILAKTHRDRIMATLDREYPEYGFARHKGYGTAEHQDAIRTHGPCPIHRMSFPVIREWCGEYSAEFYALARRLTSAKSADALKASAQTLDDRRASLADPEARKLRIMLARRWKAAKLE